MRFDDDAQFREAARSEVVKLQSGDESSLAAWQKLCKLSERAFTQVGGAAGG